MSERGHHQEDINKITLPRLQNVILGSLSKLKSIYAGMMVCECLQEIKVFNCPMVRRLPLSLDMDSKQATAPPTIRGEFEWWESLEWDEPHTKTILDPYYTGKYRYTISGLTYGESQVNYTRCKIQHYKFEVPGGIAWWCGPNTYFIGVVAPQLF